MWRWRERSVMTQKSYTMIPTIFNTWDHANDRHHGIGDECTALHAHDLLLTLPMFHIHIYSSIHQGMRHAL